ncbi:MAG: hypothetical protein ACOC1F_01010, partial [Myxococcota bacterium]
MAPRAHRAAPIVEEVLVELFEATPRFLPKGLQIGRCESKRSERLRIRCFARPIDVDLCRTIAVEA